MNKLATEIIKLINKKAKATSLYILRDNNGDYGYDIWLITEKNLIAFARGLSTSFNEEYEEDEEFYNITTKEQAIKYLSQNDDFAIEQISGTLEDLENRRISIRPTM